MHRIRRYDGNADPVNLGLQGRILAEWADLLARERAEPCDPIWRVVVALLVAAGRGAPFDGDHTASIQVLNTSNPPDGDGPNVRFRR